MNQLTFTFYKSDDGVNISTMQAFNNYRNLIPNSDVTDFINHYLTCPVFSNYGYNILNITIEYTDSDVTRVTATLPNEAWDNLYFCFICENKTTFVTARLPFNNAELSKRYLDYNLTYVRNKGTILSSPVNNEIYCKYSKETLEAIISILHSGFNSFNRGYNFFEEIKL